MVRLYMTKKVIFNLAIAMLVLPLAFMFAGCDLLGGGKGGKETVKTLEAGTYTGAGVGDTQWDGKGNDEARPQISPAYNLDGGSLGFEIDADGLVTFNGNLMNSLYLTGGAKNYKFVLTTGNTISLQKKVATGQGNDFTWGNFNTQTTSPVSNISGQLLANGKVELTLKFTDTTANKSVWRKFEFTKN